jgi:hypothetical protein
MKSPWVFVAPLLLTVAFAQAGSPLGNEMTRLHVHTVLLVPSQAVDEFPVWSPDSRLLAVNIEGKWFKLDTAKVELREANWHGQRIGAVGTKLTLEPVTDEKVAEWSKQVRHGESNVTGKSGVRAEMQHHELSSSLVVSQGGHSSVIWKSEMENCGALSLSPSGSYLAYICETNGVFVMDIERALQTSANPH